MSKNIFLNLLFCIFLLSFVDILSQNKIKIENLKSNFAKSENKEKYYTNLVKNVDNTFKTDLNMNHTEWNKALRDAQSIFLKTNSVYNGLIKALQLPVNKDLKLQKTALEVAYTLYKTEFVKDVRKIFNNTVDKISFAIATHYLLLDDEDRIIYKEALKNRFPKYESNGLLNKLFNELNASSIPNSNEIPSILEILLHNFQDGKTIIYSFQRKNRNYPGITIIKQPNGEFVKNEDGTIFNIPQLALSYSNLPSYIPNCNTPQGLYSVVGWYISPTETIGPTPNVLLRSPFEVSPKIFYHRNNRSKNWKLKEYESLLPEFWRNYPPIFESFYAGKSGRKLIIMHGSADELKYYENKPYHPLTPTRGCLSSKEIWSEKTGKCIESDQVKLINAFKSTGQIKGFLVVIELDNKQKAISIKEIEKILKKGPQR